MKDIIEKLIEFGVKYKVLPSIDFKPEPGRMWIRVSFSYKDKRISHLFYYVPVGDGTVDNFRTYNQYFDEEIKIMLEKLEEEGDADADRD